MRIAYLVLSIMVSLFIFAINSCVYDKGEYITSVCDTMEVTYDGSVKTIVTAYCSISGCHEAGASMGDLTAYAGLKEKIDNGTFEDRVIDVRDMPPSFTGLSLTDDQIQEINCWLKAGAPEN